MKDLLDQVRRRVAGRAARPAADPFRTLALQARLTRLRCEIEELERGASPRFAVGHHAQAAMRAYDQTLAEACELMGLPVPTGDGPSSRLLAEASLLHAGWSW